MGKFEKKLKNKLKQDVQEFDEWYDMNHSRFPQFEEEPYTQHDKIYARIAIKAKSLWVPLVTFCTALILGILMISNFTFVNKNNEATFSDEGICYEKTSDNEKTS